MGGVNLLISNGTCFYAPGKQASDNMIPCGNAASGTYNCCEEGDFCLESNICYNTNHSTTYMAGCTNEEFGSSNCPTKGNSDQPLLNLVQCEDTKSEGTVVWSACPGPSTRTKIGAPQACTCSDPDNGIMTATTQFVQVASLPTAIGETISFDKDHTPKAKGHTTVTSTAENGQQTTMTEATAASTADSSSSNSGSGGLSTGAKAGIGVGVAALAVGLMALAAFFFIWYRRKNSKGGPGGDGAANNPAAAHGPDHYQSPPPQYASPAYQYGGLPVSPMGEAPLATPGFAGFKSELPAEGVKPVLKSELPAEGEVRPAFQSELPAGDLDIATSQALDRNGTPSVLSVGAASPAPTGHASMVSDVSNDGQGRGPNGGNMAPIAELHG
ncbi:hypothetical protein VMCG_05830 [Cytospora schulzeri]|uniref:Mid2 domain-containing protein n=1 Tax=Cytospora schulzeri TaxID=448051 RepID=A0A423WHZ7_9PEZI|nr:hypothetical protein VMCG_05830 [Valsa malicola]